MALRDSSAAAELRVPLQGDPLFSFGSKDGSGSGSLLFPRLSAWAWAAASLFCFALAATGFALLGHAHERPSIHPGYHGLLTVPEFIGLLLITWASPPAFLLLGALGMHLLLAGGSAPSVAAADSDDEAVIEHYAQLRRRQNGSGLLRNLADVVDHQGDDSSSSSSAGASAPRMRRSTRVVAYTALAALSACAVVYCWSALIQPQVIFAAGFGPAAGQGDPLSGAFGYMLQTAFLVSFAAFGAAAARLHAEGSDSAAASGGSGGANDDAINGGGARSRLSRTSVAPSDGMQT